MTTQGLAKYLVGENNIENGLWSTRSSKYHNIQNQPYIVSWNLRWKKLQAASADCTLVWSSSWHPWGNWRQVLHGVTAWCHYVTKSIKNHQALSGQNLWRLWTSTLDTKGSSKLPILRNPSTAWTWPTMMMLLFHASRENLRYQVQTPMLLTFILQILDEIWYDETSIVSRAQRAKQPLTLRPHGKYLLGEQGRFLCGMEALMLMGLPVDNMNTNGFSNCVTRWH